MQTEVTIKRACLISSDVTTKDAVLLQIAKAAAQDVPADETEIYKKLTHREKAGSTGFGDGIALPHCHIPGLPAFVVGIVSAPHGIEFDAMDGKPVQLAVFIIAPAERRNEHIALLTSVSRVLSNQQAVKELLQHTDDEELLSGFRKWWRAPKHEPETDQKAMLQVFVQRQALLPDIIEAVSEAVPGHIAIVEGRNARTYLHRLPLFAGFWTDTEEKGLQIVTAVVDADRCNEIARRIMLLSGDSDNPGVLVSAQDLRFVTGHLEL